jgi:hypothetical protein
MRTGTQLAALLLLIACLTACGHAAQPEASIAPPAAALPASVAPPTPTHYPSVADSELAIARAAADRADRADREQTLRVQKLLRDQARQHKLTSDAVQRGDGSERCMDGQKLRHVANGWEQAGAC